MTRQHGRVLFLAALALCCVSAVAAFNPYHPSASFNPHQSKDATAIKARANDPFEAWLSEQRQRLQQQSTLTHADAVAFGHRPAAADAVSFPSFPLPGSGGGGDDDEGGDQASPTFSSGFESATDIPLPPTGPGLPAPPRPQSSAAATQVATDIPLPPTGPGLPPPIRGHSTAAAMPTGGALVFPPPGAMIPDTDQEDEDADNWAGTFPPMPSQTTEQGSSAPEESFFGLPPAATATDVTGGAAALTSAKTADVLVKKPSPEFAALAASAAPATSPSANDDAISNVESFNAKLRSINAYNTVGAIILIATGLFFVFSGHQLFKLVLFIAGAYTGGILAFAALSAIENHGHSFGSSRDLWFLIASLVLGLIVGTLFLCVWKLGLVAVGGVLGFTLSMMILSLASNGLISHGVGRTIFIIVMVLIGAVAILFLERPVLIIGTSVTGAFAVAWGVDVFVRQGLVEATQQFVAGQGVYVPNTWVYVELGGVVALALVGILVQWQGLKGKERRRGGGGDQHKQYHQKARTPLLAPKVNHSDPKLVAEFERVVVSNK
ncbi:hypothetical protein HKX48_006361 [Thoreauomyces humboldtii]|nr:hypothetical protein HKX48_006361 [Thoreauomyces humboldtii]